MAVRSKELTISEISNLWSSYLKNSMELQFFTYFFQTAEDRKVRKIVGRLLQQSGKNLKQLQYFFHKESMSAPIGFTDDDINIKAGKVFSDHFILFFCHDITQLSLSTYPSALGESTRKDIRDYFEITLKFTLKIQNEIVDLMLSKGIYPKPPKIKLDDRIDFARSIKYLNGFMGGSRALNAPEIANLSRLTHRAQFSRKIFATFSHISQRKDMKDHFSKGRALAEDVLRSLQELIDKENIPVSTDKELTQFDVDLPPFSEKMMLFFVNTCIGIFCFSIISQAMTSSLRSDIIIKLLGISKNMSLYYGKGLVITIKENWLEQPPQAAGR
ncbi:MULTISPECIES: DUF3231 family protein [Cytobacillus]|uniref:DUF3231 family protein n=1 Tax=Cytobacillus TaxID=2675230 RepID=UPI00203A8260|nr:DUF3231 family protein [Cytobacillus firmus]MCM3708601.1 DUF3231 family protein [Cytobacillus firmus]